MFVAKDLQTKILKRVSLALAPGECISVAGPSGSGKSVLLRALADLDETSGDVRLGGVSRNNMEAPEWRQKVRYLAAEPGYWADIVGDHFADPAKAGKLLETLGVSADAMNWPVERLSTGEKQRIGLVMALVDNPPVILADEPTSALDEKSAAQVENLLAERLKAGAAIILVSHDAKFSKRFADRHFEIKGEQLVEVMS